MSARVCLRNTAKNKLRSIVVAGAFTFALALIPACSKSATPAPAQIPPGTLPLLGADCDPMVPTHCGLPMPSSVYLADDPTSATGKRVKFGATTLPAYMPNTPNDPTSYDSLDGFSPGQAPMTLLPGATTTGFATADTIAHSLDADSPTILLEADTGALVPHFAELDVRAPSDDDRALILRPAARLKDATRYIVALRNVVDENGAPLPPSDVFRALRDGTDSSDPSVGARRALYADIFDKLTAAGVDQNSLQIAWDFTTGSRDAHTRQLLHMRDDALAQVGDLGPTYTVTNVEENPNAYIRRRITGTFHVPLYLDSTVPGGHLVLDSSGFPVQNGSADFDFVVHVPNSVVTAGVPAPLVQNGHGLLGNYTEGEDDYLAEIANTEGYVAFSVNLVGMDSDENSYLTNALAGDIGQFSSSVDRQHQGLVNELLAMRMMKGSFAQDPNVQFNGASVIDPTRTYYRGDSQGGIFGATYMAISTDVTRGLLGEPGMPYSFLFDRSVDFSGFSALFHIVYKSSIDVQIVYEMMQMLWDRTEPDGYAPYISQNLLANTPSHQVLIDVALGDLQVTTLGAHYLARTVSAMNMSPVNAEVFGVPDVNAPYSGNAMVEFSFGLPPIPLTNEPPTGTAATDPHGKVRTLPDAMTAADTFFKTGVVTQTCPGPCAPE